MRTLASILTSTLLSSLRSSQPHLFSPSEILPAILLPHPRLSCHTCVAVLASLEPRNLLRPRCSPASILLTLGWWSAAWAGTCPAAPRVRYVITNQRFPGWRRGGAGRGRAVTKLYDARLGIIIWVFVVGSHGDFDGRRVPHLAQGSQIKGRGRERERKKVIYSVCLQKVSDYLSISNKEIP